MDGVDNLILESRVGGAALNTLSCGAVLPTQLPPNP